ncbi:Heat shock protein GrpE [Fructilactobacillus florum 8D]|uniref:Protein GrpE n=2 Tax=Fructilactobacillus florum TaxID=640331 RepID=W9EFL5_9LACO|nr:nucleotide exchange factor GrpE [Fructilactobacillus florum]ETO40898.1 Heat shock protein GrpE [Fructilactobacillus florum 8D]KRM91403.1 heat shock protein GrpE [Fructilactobacillus florum DSM 22689 = JCM 16035]
MSTEHDKQQKSKQVDETVANKAKAKKEAPVNEATVDPATEKIKQLQAKLDQTQNDYLRAQAEIQNIEKSNRKEREALAKYGAQDLAKEVVPVLDDLDRALTVKVNDDSGKQLKNGIEIVQQHLKKALQDNQITEIKAVGEPFDPNQHQAIQTVAVSEEHPKNTVVQVLQTGYLLDDRVLRPAMVVVAQ